MATVAIFSSLLLAITLALCYGFPWPLNQNVPAELREVSAEYEEETITHMHMRNAKYFEELMKHDAFLDIKDYQVSVKLFKMEGSSCGKDQDPIVVNKITLPDVILFGENATFSADVTIKKDIPTITLAKTVVQKVGSLQIPCIDNIGTCNYTNPCELLEAITCPPEMIKAGWNCRCPLHARHFVLPPVTIDVPQIPLPGFLINGEYEVTVQLFNSEEELICYKFKITLKKD